MNQPVDPWNQLKSKDGNSPARLPLEQALKIGIQEKPSFVYKMTVGGKSYVGFTSQEPQTRLEQHISSAKEGSKQKVHVALRRFGYLNDFEVLSEHPNEVLALVAEISAIEKLKPELNTSIGGEGSYYNVTEGKNHLGENVFYVENSKLVKKEVLRIDRAKHLDAKNERHYLKTLIGRINHRYMRLEKEFSTELVELTKHSIPIHNLAAPNVHNYVNHREWITRLDVLVHAQRLAARHKKLANSDEDFYLRARHRRDHNLIILLPAENKIRPTRLGKELIERTIDTEWNLFSSEAYPEINRIIYHTKVLKEDSGFESTEEAEDFIHNLKWFSDANKIGAFRPGDLFIAPCRINCGYYKSGFLNLVSKQNYQFINIEIKI